MWDLSLYPSKLCGSFDTAIQDLGVHMEHKSSHDASSKSSSLEPSKQQTQEAGPAIVSPTDMLRRLPVETISEILSYLSIQDIANVRSSHRYYVELIDNEPTSDYNTQSVRAGFKSLRASASCIGPETARLDLFKQQIEYMSSHLETVRADDEPYIISFHNWAHTDALLKLDQNLTPSSALACQQRYWLITEDFPPNTLLGQLTSVHGLHITFPRQIQPNPLNLTSVSFPRHLKEIRFQKLYNKRTSDMIWPDWPACVEGLDLSLNFLGRLRTKIVWPPSCVRLNLSRNDLWNLDNYEWQSLKNLTSLDLSQNSIAQLNHPGWYSLDNLTFLNLSHNSIESIITRLPPNLKTLNLGSNYIRTLRGVVFPEGMTSLDISGNKTLPTFADASLPIGLQSLHASAGFLYDLKGLDHLDNLTTLDVSFNFIEYLEHVKLPRYVECLDLSGNPLRSMKHPQWPESLKTLTPEILLQEW